MSTVKCSFNKLVGGNCSNYPKDRKKSTEILPLQSCKRDIAGHKSLWLIPDEENKVELILARASIFSSPDHKDTLSHTICPAHRASLSIGWCRGSNRCRVREELSQHENGKASRRKRKWPRAERGIGKAASEFVLKKMGRFLPVGTDKE